MTDRPRGSETTLTAGSCPASLCAVGFMMRAVGARGYLGGTLGGLASAVLLGSCVGIADPCWDLSVGKHLTLELVEPYTPDSSYPYQRLPQNPASTFFLDENPSCGAAFDYSVGETLDITVNALAEPDNSNPTVCRSSEFTIDSPMRLQPTRSRVPGAFQQGGKPILFNGDDIVVDGCATFRSMTLVSTDTFPGAISDPVAGQVPPLVLVRAAVIRGHNADGSCDTGSSSSLPDQYCVDQFVVRVTRE